jgi:heme-degrading monooxygenase HmoA
MTFTYLPQNAVQRSQTTALAQENGHRMFVVIFRAKIAKLDDEYNKVAQRLRDLALTEFGCLEFHALTEGNDEIALSYWPDQDKIRAWKQHSDHLIAQELGKKDWYESYSVQVCEVKRQYNSTLT